MNQKNINNGKINISGPNISTKFASFNLFLNSPVLKNCNQSSASGVTNGRKCK